MIPDAASPPGARPHLPGEGLRGPDSGGRRRPAGRCRRRPCASSDPRSPPPSCGPPSSPGELADALAPEAYHGRGGHPAWEVTDVFDDIHVLVNATESGSADKVVFEAMAAARPVLVASRAFDGLFDPAECALKLRPPRRACDRRSPARPRRATPATLDRIGGSLRRTVECKHSLGHWADQVAACCLEIGPRFRRGPRRWIRITPTLARTTRATTARAKQVSNGL